MGLIGALFFTSDISIRTSYKHKGKLKLNLITTPLSNSCESLGKTKVKAGTETTDAECSNGEPSHLLILSVCGVCVLAFAICLIVIIVKKKNIQHYLKQIRIREFPKLLGFLHLYENLYILCNKLFIIRDK